jgi:Glycine-zipper domain
MKRTLILTVLIVLAAQVATHAQTATSTAPAQQQKTLAATIGVYVFPTAGQSPSVQNQDEGACYTWAVQNSGVDPFQLSQQAQAQQQAIATAPNSPTAGSGARGAARGAAGGALFGAIAGDAGKGAAIGAAAGAVGGRMRSRGANEQAKQQASANTAAATQEQMTNFKKAFSACLEGKKYTVKF